MNAKEFFDKVVEMRKLQKEYFRKRDVMVLKKAKKAEAEIDAEIQRVNDKQTHIAFDAVFENYERLYGNEGRIEL